MALTDLLLAEFDSEMKKTRSTLERLPDEKANFQPHEKSMPMVKLGNHTADLRGFLTLMLTTDEIDLTKMGGNRPAPPASGAERISRYDEGTASARALLAGATDEALHQPWKLQAGDRTVFDGTRYQAIRAMFFNHMIHHRAQLGVYLRLTDCPVPSIYGPSADEK